MSSLSQIVGRRDFIRGSSQLALSAVLAPWVARAATPTAVVDEVTVISKQPEYYNGWSTVARRQNGDLWLAWSVVVNPTYVRSDKCTPWFPATRALHGVGPECC